MKLLKKKRLQSNLLLNDQLSFLMMHSLATNQHRLKQLNKDFKNVIFLEKCYNSKCNAISLNRKSRFD